MPNKLAIRIIDHIVQLTCKVSTQTCKRSEKLFRRFYGVNETLHKKVCYKALFSGCYQLTEQPSTLRDCTAGYPCTFLQAIQAK